MEILHWVRNILDGVFRFADYVDISRECAWWIIILTEGHVLNVLVL